MFRNCMFRSRLWSRNAMCSGQGQNLSQGLGQVGLERQGLTGCQGPNVGGVTPQNERMQEIFRMTQGLDPMAILKAALNGHPRTVTLINAYSEGVNLLSSDVGVNPDLQSSNGFELIRQLTMEYSLRTQFQLACQWDKPQHCCDGHYPEDRLWECMLWKLLGTLASSIDATGLQVAEADLVAVLRSLPESIRTFCLHHTSGKRTKVLELQRWDGNSNKGLLQNSNPRNSCTS